MSFLRLKYLIEASLRQTATEDELEELEYLCQRPENQEAVHQLIRQALEEAKSLEDLPEVSAERIRNTILSEGRDNNKRPGNSLRVMMRRVAAAAILLLFAGAGMLFFYQKDTSAALAVNKPAVSAVNTIVPGTNRATLTLDDGTLIILDSAENGQLQKAGNTKIIKVSDGLLSYASNEKQPEATATYSKVATPRGGQYMVELADGTKAWLNAASSIRFPNVFDDKERSVEISGEVYFEVAKASSPGLNRVPFVVNCNGVQVNVLGTHFNVMAYPEEKNIQTTLFEGSVAVNKEGNTAVLKPGEQMNIPDAGSYSVQKLNDPERVIAWKNGRFELNGNIQGIMRQIARWYDVEVKYEGNVTDKQFGGAISRSEAVQQVLKLLQLTENIRFRIQDKTIIVSP